MKGFIKVLAGAALTAVLGSLLTAAVSAQMIDLAELGSVTIKFIEESGTPVTDGDFTIYGVAVLSQQGNSLVYTYSDDFYYCDVDLSGTLDQSMAEAIYKYAREHNVSGITKTLGSDGRVIFDDLPLGLYLVTQSKASTGYSAAVPFLAAVPYYKDGEWVYAVEAEPKIELSGETTTESGGGSDPETTTEVTETTTEGSETTTTGSGGGGSDDPSDDDDDDDDDSKPGGGRNSYVIGGPDPEEYTPSSSHTPSSPSSHDDPSDDDSDPDDPDPNDPDVPDEPKGEAESEEPKEELPQTGQNNLPVPIMTVCGLFLFSLGWKLSFTDGRKKNAP